MDRDIRVLSLAALAAAILTPALAAAQAPPKASPPIAPKTEQLDPNACAHRIARPSGRAAISTCKKRMAAI